MPKLRARNEIDGNCSGVSVLKNRIADVFLNFKTFCILVRNLQALGILYVDAILSCIIKT